MTVYHKTQEEAEDMIKDQDLIEMNISNILDIDGTTPRFKLKLTEKQII